MENATREAEKAPVETAAMAVARSVVNVKNEYDADIYWFCGPVTRASVQKLSDEYARSEHRSNCVIVLTTLGGDPDAAYVLARFFKRAYNRVSVYVFGLCKSAGTLACLGVDEIVMSAFGELGPLDIQLSKDDSLAARTSGLDIFQASAIISTQAFNIFQQHFLGIVGGSGGVITTKTAADIATSVAAQLLTPITAQIDPLRLGEMQRALQVATEYGNRLGVDTDTVRRLAMDYPAHGFVIDLEEAEQLFPEKVRIAEPVELELEAALRALAMQRYGQDIVRDSLDDRTVHLCLTPARAFQHELELEDDAHGTEHDDLDAALPEFEPNAGGASGGTGEPPGAGDRDAPQQKRPLRAVPSPRARRNGSE